MPTPTVDTLSTPTADALPTPTVNVDWVQTPQTPPHDPQNLPQRESHPLYTDGTELVGTEQPLIEGAGNARGRGRGSRRGSAVPHMSGVQTRNTRRARN